MQPVNRSRLRVCWFSLLACLLAFAPAASAAVDSFQFSSEENAQRYHMLVEELRCPVCLSSNLAGSDSPISADLRREVFRLVERGLGPAEIREHMYARYGDFILYRPRLTPFTLLLYATPLLLVAIGLFVIVRLLRSRRRAGMQTVGDEDAQAVRIAQLLAEHSLDPVQDTSGQAPRSANAA